MEKLKIFYDLKTTGFDYRKHSVHQIGLVMELNGEVICVEDIKTRPHPKALLDPAALEYCNVTKEQVLSYPPMGEAHKKLIGLLAAVIDRFNKKDKAWLIGYNNRSFDDHFLRKWFEQNLDKFFGSWFFSDSQDVLVLASNYLENQRPYMPSFKLHRVAKTLGLTVDEDELHNAAYDVELTRKIYHIVSNQSSDLL